jgi:hypothetical protein
MTSSADQLTSADEPEPEPTEVPEPVAPVETPEPSVEDTPERAYTRWTGHTSAPVMFGLLVVVLTGFGFAPACEMA